MKAVKVVLAVGCLLIAGAVPGRAQQLSDEQQAELRQLMATERAFHPQSGDVTIPGAKAVLHLGQSYYYLPPDEAKKVIVEIWRNPPGSADAVLGLVMESGKHVYDNAWGAVITYDPMGYVSDEDARTADYADLLAKMQSGENERNEERRKAGYPRAHLVGWAQQPSYDATTHAVVWAQNIAFEDQVDNTLNYDIRLLGRRGVLSLNMVTAMSRLGDARMAAGKLAGSAGFMPGERYADFQEGVDSKAGIGIAGLVAAGVGLVAAKKVGMIAVFALFAKKFLVLILAAFAALGARFRKLFGFFRRRETQDEPLYAESESLEAVPAPIEEPQKPEAPGTV